MSGVPFAHVLFLSAALFAVGLAGLFLRRNLLVLLMSLELMINAANLVFVAAARQWGDGGGHVLMLLVVAVAACEAAVGLAIAVGLFRATDSVSVDGLRELRG